MDKISKFLSADSKYTKLSGPLQAAHVCDAARAVARSRFMVVSFADGMLTVATENSSAAANLQMESAQIIIEINHKLGQDLVQRLRFKII